ncbi:MAG TPA: hypothetical protein VK801_08160 [Caulobacteraceae bacterium]|jgi:hypothetical protein|nr:hypothetical protein [Caulobacteraceae bacterium]
MSGKPDKDKTADNSAAFPHSHANRAADAAPGDLQPGEDLAERQEKLIDEAVQETFPASDPISPKRIV